MMRDYRKALIAGMAFVALIFAGWAGPASAEVKSQTVFENDRVRIRVTTWTQPGDETGPIRNQYWGVRYVVEGEIERTNVDGTKEPRQKAGAAFERSPGDPREPYRVRNVGSGPAKVYIFELKK